MKGMGLGMGPEKPAEEEPEGADALAMRAFAKALKGSDSAAQLAAFRELMAACGEHKETDDDEE